MNPIANYWRRWNIQKTLDGNISAMNRVYLLRDPWGLDCAEERVRFMETTRIIRERIGDHFDSVLEVGCGEGLQSKYLAPLTEQLVGLDPSPTAIKRAQRTEIANASFFVGELMEYEPERMRTFDLVTACEVLYYVRDLDRAWAKLAGLARNCVVTYYQGEFDRLDKYFAGKDVRSETIRSASCQWRIVYGVGSGGFVV